VPRNSGDFDGLSLNRSSVTLSESEGLAARVAHTLSCMYATRGVALRLEAGAVQRRRFIAKMELSSR
jgi:hypothetical protein